MRSVEVRLGERSYNINIGRGLISRVGEIAAEVARSTRVMLISNPTVFALYGDLVVASLDQAGLQVCTGLIPDGEANKTLAQVEKMIDLAVNKRLDRQTLVVTLGGGVIGDLGGLVAAIYQRGIDFLQVPTTLLAQVDSSVGGKVAVNHRQAKNMIGAFHQPRAVVIDTNTLTTLDEREFRAGMGEVVKYGLALDRAFFAFLENSLEAIKEREGTTMADIVGHACRIKAGVVEQDETEQGIRAVLNLGHTFGHALETLTGYRVYRHGEAVAVGMVVASSLARQLGLLSDEEAGRVKLLLQALGLPVVIPDLDTAQIISAMYRDKKMQAGKLRLVLPQGIGRTVIRDDLEPEAIMAAIEQARVPE